MSGANSSFLVAPNYLLLDHSQRLAESLRKSLQPQYNEVFLSASFWQSQASKIAWFEALFRMDRSLAQLKITFLGLYREDWVSCSSCLWREDFASSELAQSWLSLQSVLRAPRNGYPELHAESHPSVQFRWLNSLLLHLWHIRAADMNSWAYAQPIFCNPQEVRSLDLIKLWHWELAGLPCR